MQRTWSSAQPVAFVTLDDDVAYLPYTLASLEEAWLAQGGCAAVGHAGFQLLAGAIVYTYLDPTVAEVDVLQGFVGVLYPAQHFDGTFVTYATQSHAHAKLSDDLMISNWLALRNVPRRLAPQSGCVRSTILQALRASASEATAGVVSQWLQATGQFGIFNPTRCMALLFEELPELAEQHRDRLFKHPCLTSASLVQHGIVRLPQASSAWCCR